MTRLHELALLALAAVPFLLLVAVGVGRFIRTGRAESKCPCGYVRPCAGGCRGAL